MSDTTAKASGKDLPISTKKSVEICNMIRGRTVERSIRMLEEVVSLNRAVPFRRYNQELPHQKGVGPGRFPVKAAKEILKLLKSVETNAQNKGLNTASLVITLIKANKAGNQFRYGRQIRRKMKRTHIDIEVTEQEPKKEPKAEKKEELAKDKKAETVPKKAPEKKESTLVKEEPAKKEAEKKEAPKPAKEEPKPEQTPKPKEAEKKEAPKPAKEEPTQEKTEPKEKQGETPK